MNNTSATRAFDSSGWEPVGRFEGSASVDPWRTWSPRKEIAPSFRTTCDDPTDRCHLEINGKGKPESYGAWQCAINDVTPGAAYRLSVNCRFQNVQYPTQSLFARLDWFTRAGERLRPLDNAQIQINSDGTSARFEHCTLAPPNADKVVLELGLRWSEGSVAWKLPNFERAPVICKRPVTLATVFHRPRDTGSAAASVASMCDVIESKAPANADLICLPEGITVIGTGKTYADVAEPIPGPTTETLGKLAQRRGCYLVAGIYERVGSLVYNTAVLIDRTGCVAGTYRKTHLPQEEADAGLMPGDGGYPVFQTDFGTIGIMICWDLQFPEPARGLAGAGAEVILLPIWGGSEVLARARAIENHVYLVSSSYDMRTMIVDPAGNVLAETSSPGAVASATVDLNALVLQMPWLGDLRIRTWSDRRADLA